MKKLIIPAVFTGMLLISGCGQTVEEEAKETVEVYMEAVENEELETVIEMLSTDHEYEMPDLAFEMLFDSYDLDYDIESMKVITSDEDKVVIEVVQVTKKLSGPDFIQDSRVTATHTLVKEDGDLKFLKTEYSNAEVIK
jgi:PBP1b-binding outer membrane lipoprotein LpoB